MLEIGMVNIAMFFVVIGICLIFIAAWIIKSESRGSIFKEEIDNLKNQATGLEREKFSLLEKISSLESSSVSPTCSEEASLRLSESAEKIDSLESENNNLKRELAEAKSSLEEFYKSLST